MANVRLRTPLGHEFIVTAKQARTVYANYPRVDVEPEPDDPETPAKSADKATHEQYARAMGVDPDGLTISEIRNALGLDD